MPPNQLDPYTVLGVPSNATQTEISRAYRALLRRHHPDTRTPGDEGQNAMSDLTLQRVVAAYQILGDPDRRAAYDRRARPREQGRRAQAQHGLHHGVGDAQPPIVAGPARWHPAPEPPPPSP